MYNQDENAMEKTSVVTTVETTDQVAMCRYLANQEQNEGTVRQALTRHPKRMMRVIFAIYVRLITSFDDQVGSVVISIPQIQKRLRICLRGQLCSACQMAIRLQWRSIGLV